MAWRDLRLIAGPTLSGIPDSRAHFGLRLCALALPTYARIRPMSKQRCARDPDAFLCLALLFILVLSALSAPGAPTPKAEREGNGPVDGTRLPPPAIKRLGTLAFRHGDRVRCVVVSTDGKKVASASE